MTRTTTTIRSIQRVERLLNTESGNPRYRIHYMDGGYSQMTEPDAAAVYTLPNAENIGVPVIVTSNRQGRVVSVVPA